MLCTHENDLPGRFFLTSPFVEGLNNAGLLEPLDHELIPNLSNLYPEATKIPYDVGNVFSVPYSWGTTGIRVFVSMVALVLWSPPAGAIGCLPRGIACGSYGR